MSGNPVGLVEFLLARLSDKAAAVQPFVNEIGECRPWFTVGSGGAVRTTPVLSGDDGLVATCGTHLEAVFIADNDPAYVLADIAAKRRIIEQYREARDAVDRLRVAPRSGGKATAAATFEALHRVVLLFAAPFSSHPEWQPEWSTE